MGFTVSAQEIARLDGKIQTLDTDVRAFQGPKLFPTPGSAKMNPQALKWQRFRNLDWNAFHVEWGQWRNTHQTVLSQTGDQVGAEFANHESRYNELRRRFADEFAGFTTAKQSSEAGPVEELAADLGKVALVLLGLWALTKVKW